jgi:hypothetical protein
MLEGMPEDLDLQTIFGSPDGSITESEALEVKALLRANGIDAMIVNDSPLASLGHDVRVAKEDLKAAQRVIAEARAVGPSGAAEAERQSEIES